MLSAALRLLKMFFLSSVTDTEDRITWNEGHKTAELNPYIQRIIQDQNV